MTDLSKAVAIRDALLPVIKQHGERVNLARFKTRTLEVGGFTYTTAGPFKLHPDDNVAVNHLLSIEQGDTILLSIEWGEDGVPSLLEFHPGDWEAIALPPDLTAKEVQHA